MSDAVILGAALTKIAQPFRDRIVDNYLDLKRRARTGDAKGAASAQSGFCESVLRFLQQDLTGAHIAFGVHIKNFLVECQKLESAPPTAQNESQRLIVPKALTFLQTIRNKRGGGHAAGDVDANIIDLLTVVRTADWIVCELLRLYHSVTLEAAQQLVDGLASRQVTDVWTVGDHKRVLRPELKAPEQTLLLLYHEPKPVGLDPLWMWVKYSSLKDYRRRVIRGLDDRALIFYDTSEDTALLSPLGEKQVEEVLLSGSV